MKMWRGARGLNEVTTVQNGHGQLLEDHAPVPEEVGSRELFLRRSGGGGGGGKEKDRDRDKDRNRDRSGVLPKCSLL